MNKNEKRLIQAIDFALDDYLYDNVTFRECICKIFYLCYKFLTKKGVSR